jgi:hypothetical protein
MAKKAMRSGKPGKGKTPAKTSRQSMKMKGPSKRSGGMKRGY